MSNASLGSISVDLTLQSAQFVANANKAAQQAQQTGKTIEDAFAKASGALKGLAAAFAIDQFLDAAQRAFDYADAIVDISNKAAVTTKTLQEFRYAAQLSGSSTDDADAALAKFAKNLGDAQNGGDAMAKTLKDLGVNTTDVDTALQQAADGIAKLPTGAQRAAATMEIMGKSAGTLTALMEQGSKGFNKLANDAESLGIVLGDDLLQNAGQVNDKLDTLKMILDAQFAAAIVSNADAIGSLAGGLISLVSALGQFWSKDPAKAMAIMGALGGGAAGTLAGGPVGGLIGAASGAIGGYAMGNDVAQGQYARNAKWAHADATAKWAHDAQTKAMRDGASSSAVSRFATIRTNAEKEKARIERGIQDGSIRTDTPQITAGTTRETNGANLHGPKAKPAKKKSGPTAEQLAEKEAARLEGFYKDLESAQNGMLQEQLHATVEVSAQADIQRRILDLQHKGELDEITAKVATKKLHEDEAKQLRDLVDARYAVALENIGKEENDRLNREKLEISMSGIENERDLLSSSQELARTAKERRAIALRLVDLQYRQEKEQLEAIVASQTATNAEKQIAEARLALLPRLKGQAVDKANGDTMGPLAAYFDAIPKTADEINEQMESIQTEGLDHLADGLLDAAKGVGSLKDAFADMADSVISGLLKIAIQQMIIKPLGSLLFGGGEGGGSGILGGLFASIGKGIAGARANGGMTQPGNYLVGERGAEIVSIGAPANVSTASATRSITSAAGRNGITVNFGPITSNDPDAIRRVAIETIGAMSPVLRQQAVDATMSKLQRRTL